MLLQWLFHDFRQSLVITHIMYVILLSCISDLIIGLLLYAIITYPVILNHISTPTWAEEADMQSVICTIGRFLALPSNSIMTSIMHHTITL